MKMVFLITTYGTLYLVFMKFKATYDSNHDTFRAEFLVIPAVGLAVLVNHEFSVMEVREGGGWEGVGARRKERRDGNRKERRDGE